MSEAPKKIWYRSDEELASADKLDEDDILYIRGDIVLELVNALEKLARLGNGDSYGNSVGNEIAQNALAKYREDK